MQKFLKKYVLITNFSLFLWSLNAQSPGFDSKYTQNALALNYDDSMYDKDKSQKQALLKPDAYARLLFDVMKGNNSAFVRDDELALAWGVFTPFLHAVDDKSSKSDKSPKLHVYKVGSGGPREARDKIQEWGFDTQNNSEIKSGYKLDLFGESFRERHSKL